MRQGLLLQRRAFGATGSIVPIDAEKLAPVRLGFRGDTKLFDDLLDIERENNPGLLGTC